MDLSLETKIFACLVKATEARRRHDFPTAHSLIEAAFQLTDRMSSDQAEGFRALGHCSLALLHEQEGPRDGAAKLRQKAMLSVDGISNADVERAKPFDGYMSALLIALREYQRAIPFCEKAVQQALEANEPIEVAHMLSREGHCYWCCGLRDQAAIVLRAALKILRDYPGEPSLTDVLIGLGNALGKSSPNEAEELYKEAVDIHLARGQLESATAPWVNLGVLCSKQGRYAEALDYYQKALTVREKSPSTSPIQLALLLNNIANCHSHLGHFEQALKLIDQAIEMLKPENSPKVASAYGSKGQILHEAGSYVEAVDWLRKSYAERQKEPSPNYELIIENLGYEIDALKRLGMIEEAIEAETKLTAARNAMNAFPESNADISALTAEPAGAVLIELAFGTRPGGRYGTGDAEAVLEQIFAILAVAQLGKSMRRALGPESITLIFYGENAEVMFEAIKEFLFDHLVFAGAVVSIRQGRNVRQVMVPSLLN